MSYSDVSSFFFSSRRRHTRFDCDWSSDVCSSDLGGEPRWDAAGLSVVRREPQRRDHAGRNRGTDRTAVRESPAHLGAGSRPGERREPAVFEASRETLPRGDAEGPAETVRGRATSPRLAARAGRSGGAVLSGPGWRGDLSALPERAEETERAGHARAVREADRGGTREDRGQLPEAQAMAGRGGAASRTITGPEHTGGGSVCRPDRS